MKIIVGLGNPGSEYENTFHNLGFKSIDAAARFLGVRFDKEKFKGLIAETKINGEKVILLKPQTYMNLSGESVKEVMSFYKADLKDLLVIYDDVDLYKGSVRIRESGSAGTHNGMRNIVKELGSGNFLRVRVGFKPIGGINIPLVDYVLSGIKAPDAETFAEVTALAGRAAADFAEGVSSQQIMQKYNLTVQP